jgi:primase-polymerase (primpol)-like protein
MLEETWENIPRVMRDAKHWLCYRLVDKGEGQRLSKPPYSPKTGIVVDKTDETHWASFHRAYGSVEQHGFDGLGFVFDNGFIAIDLDDCFVDNGH